MATATTTATTLTGAATEMYLGWVNASLTANERMARVARVWIDETLGFQQDLTETIKKAIEESRAQFTTPEDTANPTAFLSRAGDVARSNYFLWTETGLKAQERFARVAQTAFGEIQAAQTDMTNQAESRISNFTKRAAK